jgi:hypothetical protein
MSRGDQTLGTRQLDILSFSSNAEVASFGNLGKGVSVRLYDNGLTNSSYLFGMSNSQIYASNVSGPVTTFSLGTGTLAGVSNITPAAGSSTISLSGASLTSVQNITLTGSMFDSTGSPLKLGGGITEYENITGNTASLSYSNASVIVPADNTLKDITLPAISGNSAPAFQQKFIYATGSNYSFSVTSSNANNSASTQYFTQGTDISEIEYVWTSNAWSYVGQRNSGTGGASFTTYTLGTTTTITTNDATDANRVLFTFSLGGGSRYLLVGNLSYSNLDSVAATTSTWTKLGLYSGSVPTLSATPLQSVPVTTVTGHNIGFTFAIDTTGQATTTTYYVSLVGSGQRLQFGATNQIKLVPVQTARGLGVNDSVSVSRSIQMNPVRQVFAPGSTTTSFNVTQSGQWTASASNVDVYINGNKYVYRDASNKDYDVLVNYTGGTNTTTYTVSLASGYSAVSGDIVEITVWPTVTATDYYQSGYFYQGSTLATSAPWLNVSGGGVRYNSRVIVDGDLIVQGNVYGGSNTSGFASGLQYDNALDPVNSNVFGTLNLVNGAVTTAKMSFDGSVLPTTDAAYDIGATAYRWRNLYASGTITGTSKNFCIDHPVRPDYSLIYCSIEAPRVDIIHRGKTTLSNGTAIVNIDQECNTTGGLTSGTFVALCKNHQIFLQNESGFDSVKGSINNNVLTIQSNNASSADTISWMIISERKDAAMQKIYPDTDGCLICETAKV